MKHLANKWYILMPEDMPLIGIIKIYKKNPDANEYKICVIL